MPGIADAIHQDRFESPAHRVLINLLYSAGWAKSLSTAALKPFGLTWQQFNCLRILRGQHGVAVSLRLIADRMLDPQSNASRIVDKLEAKELVSRRPCPHDRRQVRIALTDAGRDLVERASAEMRRGHEAIGGDLDAEELDQLSALLDRFRETR